MRLSLAVLLCAASSLASAGQPGPSCRVLAVSGTSTLEKDPIDAASAQGFTVAGFVPGKTAIGGPELIAVLKK